MNKLNILSDYKPLEPGSLSVGQDYDVLQLSTMFLESKSHSLEGKKFRQPSDNQSILNYKNMGKTFHYLLLWVRQKGRDIYNVSLSKLRRKVIMLF